MKSTGFTAKQVCDSLVVVVGGAVVSGAIFLLYRRENKKVYCQNASDLPVGLPNPRNVCYFNALMQAMAANPSLVRLLKRSVHIRPDKFMYRLLCLLEGLQCSSQYIAENNLGGLLKKNHEALINDIVNTQNWAIHEQQDAHELFGFIMERACSQDNDFSSKTCARKISNLFNFNLPHHKRIVVCRSHCSAIESVKFRAILCDAFPTHVFEQILVSSRVTCNYCNYHSKVVIQPEACLNIFLRSPSTVKTNVKGLQQSYVKTSTEVIDLIECLDAQLATVEPIPDMKCPRCQKSSKSKSCSLNYCQREQWITHTPKYLVLYIQRSDWLNIASLSTESNNIRQFGGNPFSTTRIATKRSEHVHIPEFLNMAPYLLPCRILKTGALSQPVNPYHDKPSGGVLSNTSELLGRDCPKSYILRSVIVHEGAFHQCGHYITYRKWHTPVLHVQQKSYWLVNILSSLYEYVSNYFKGISNTPDAHNSPWILTSDAHVIRVPFKHVESSPAYLLFYERLRGYDDQRFGIKSAIIANGTNHRTQHSTPALSPIEDTDTSHSEIYSEDESDSDASIDKQGVFRNLSKADIIRSYALYTSASQMYDKSCDVFYFHSILFSTYFTVKWCSF
ncbi:unnamed protein product [Schistosoma margrebowiei]|uniref:ubiquitinyl hydrolase 1 n=1 Tax=Schistosoma margrebowiei TaxID=48269 RepID=A0AA84ZWN8_9TREM|nr:unnamed protein product [Schistosoma margrebowiei]